MKTEAADDSAELEDEKPQSVVELWRRQIDAEKDAHKEFRDLAKKAQDAYDKQCAYNVMWPTVEITSASLYSSTPAPEVRRRQRDGDDLQKQAAQVLERSLDFCIDSHDFDGNAQRSIEDMLVAGLGQARVLYDPTIEEVPDELSETEGETVERITGQVVGIEHYSWKHFGWQPCKSWEKCEWIYFVHNMTRKAVMDEYEVEASEDSKDEDDEKVVRVYEILHKPSKTITVIADQFDIPLDVRGDALGIKGFFPCPEPMMTNIKTDKLIPRADFKYYEEQFKKLDRVSRRIGSVVESIKAVKFYDSFFQELTKLQTAKDGMYIPVDDLISKLENSSLDSVLAEVPIEQFGAVIEMLVGNKGYLKDEVWEILGISDIMRGETDAKEGVETQQLKSEYGAIRIREKQSNVNRFCRDLFRIMGEVIAEHFEPEVLQRITGVQITAEIMQILRSDFLRSVSVDIETDSTNAGDKLRHKKEANESLKTLIDGFGALLPGLRDGTIPQQLGQELMLMLVRGVEGNTGNLEDIIAQMGDENNPEAVVAQLQQQLQQLQQQAQAMQAELEKRDQAETAKNMSVAQLNQAKAQKIAGAEIPLDQSEIELNAVEADGKRVEQAANLAVGMSNREPFIRGVE